VETTSKRILVTGGTGFLGYRVVRALLDQGADITLLVRPGGEDRLGSLKDKVQRFEADPWNPATLRARGRGHSVVVHLVGGVKPEPARGLTFRHLNYVSARNVAQMAVSDGIPHMLLLSASAAPLGISGGYIESKRDAETYLQSTGLSWTIVRAPALYVPGERRNLIYRLISVMAAVPLLGLPFTAHNPLSVDTAARGIASLTLSGSTLQNRLIGPGQLRRIGRNIERRLTPQPQTVIIPQQNAELLDETPFGWLP
jgi:uncharacterized protein YbjT (DUF2867 family)